MTNFSRASERTRAISAISSIGLVRKVVGARLQPAHAVGGLVERGHHDHRQMERFGIALEPAADLEPVHARHHHVQQYEVAFAAFADFQRLLAVGGGDHVEIFRRQPRFEQLEVRNDVVNHQNAGGHRPVLSKHARILKTRKKPERSFVADIVAHRFQKFHHRDGLRQIGLAASLADLFLIALHRESGDGDDGNRRKFGVVLQPLCDLQAGDLRQLDVHQDQIRPVLAGEADSFHAALGLDRRIAMRLQTDR